MVSTEQGVLRAPLLGVEAELQFQGVQLQEVQFLGDQLLLGVEVALKQSRGCLLCFLWALPQCQVEEVHGHLHVEEEEGEEEGEGEEEAKEEVPNLAGFPKHSCSVYTA